MRRQCVGVMTGNWSRALPHLVEAPPAGPPGHLRVLPGQQRPEVLAVVLADTVEGDLRNNSDAIMKVDQLSAASRGRGTALRILEVVRTL